MTALWLIGILLAVLGFVTTFALTNLYQRLNKIEYTAANLHETYAKKDDVNRDFKTIQDSLTRIEDKLDRKQDR